MFLNFMVSMMEFTERPEGMKALFEPHDPNGTGLVPVDAVRRVASWVFLPIKMRMPPLSMGSSTMSSLFGVRLYETSVLMAQLLVKERLIV